ncbi:chain length determinant protein tyrosine kinase EpsG [Ampullimonas aquatilis]|uniref:chain length determinant protein tyrosine kinase EpsG n=1 Tax=Ampullimonas aquatilis TaxID=1341549 RepID=UPI003C789FF3
MNMPLPNLVKAPISHSNTTEFMSRERSIGTILVEAGKLSVEEAELILQEQKVKGMKFGEAAIRLGLLTEADIEQAISRQFNYPYLQTGDTSVSQDLVAAFNPHHKTVEQLRALRSQLILRWFDGDVSRKILTIVSPARCEGRSYLAANLAIVFSQLGERTLLIDANLRNPSQHHFFKLNNRTGLTNILSGRAGSEAIVRIPGLLDLSVLPSGTLPPNPLELLGQPLYLKLLEEASIVFDAVIIDTPAALIAADAQMTAARAGATLMVTRKNYSLTADIEKTIAMLSTAKVNVIGAVINEF